MESPKKDYNLFIYFLILIFIMTGDIYIDCIK